MSIVAALAKQNLLAQKNYYQMQMLNNFSSQRGMLNNPSFKGNLEAANAWETSLALDNIDASTQLMAINAELGALNDSKLNYLA